MQMVQLILCKRNILPGEFLAARVTTENAFQEIKDNKDKKGSQSPKEKL